MGKIWNTQSKQTNKMQKQAACNHLCILHTGEYRLEQTLGTESCTNSEEKWEVQVHSSFQEMY